MAAENEYLKEQDSRNEVKISGLLDELPDFCRSFIESQENNTSSRTRLGYCQELKTFFSYLLKENPEIAKLNSARGILPEHMDMIKPADLDEYINYFRYGWYRDENKNKKKVINGSAAIQRNLSAIKSLYRYGCSREIFTFNPSLAVSMPEIKQKDIVYLEPNEMALLMDAVESGEGLTKTELKYHELIKKRDLAIIALLLGTGIRVSECVALDIDDVDIDETSILVHRKEGKVMILYYSDEVAKILSDYISLRKNMLAEHNDRALFLSLRNTRMSVRSIERRVKRYSETVTKLKHITPHKLRASFATSYYQESKDIYSLSDTLGHSSIDVVKKYAYIGAETRRKNRNTVRLRED